MPAFVVHGSRELRSQLKQIGDDSSDLRELNLDLAKLVSDTALTKVPVRSGRLKRSVRPTGSKRAAVVKAGNNRKSGPSAVPYAHPIHFGWAARRIAPQPFLYDALDERRAEVLKKYTDEVRSIVKRVM